MPPKHKASSLPPAIFSLFFLFLLLFPCVTPLPPVLWYAPFFSGGGYCSEAIGFLQSLTLENVSVHIEQHGDAINIPFVQGLPLETQQLLQKASQTRVSVRDCVCICHSEPGAWHPANYQTSKCPPSGALYRIGRTMFETDRLPSGWSERMRKDKMDEIWVPTEFHRQIFIEGGVDAERLHVIGEPVDVDFFSPSRGHKSDMRTLSSLLPSALFSKKDAHQHAHTDKDTDNERPFIYLSVFKWETRKGWDILLKAYFSAFTHTHTHTTTQKVALVLLTNAYHSSDDFETPVRELAAAHFPDRKYPEEFPPVYILSGVDATQLRALYHLADVLVMPTRGEGWGRPHVEAMAMGTPIIATNWSGPTEFLNEENGYPLRIDGLVEIEEGPFKGHKWAEPSLPHLTSLLLHTHTHQEEVKAKGAQAHTHINAHYSPAVMGKVLRIELERIEKKIKGSKKEEL